MSIKLDSYQLALIDILSQLGGGVLSDCWRREERGTATAIYSLAPFLGPAVGPIGKPFKTGSNDRLTMVQLLDI